MQDRLGSDTCQCAGGNGDGLTNGWMLWHCHIHRGMALSALVIIISRRQRTIVSCCYFKEPRDAEKHFFPITNLASVCTEQQGFVLPYSMELNVGDD